MNPTRSVVLLAVLSLAACAWSAAASAQELPKLSMPGLVTTTGKAPQAGLGGGGIPTGRQDHAPVQMGSGEGGSALMPLGTGMWPNVQQVPGTGAAPTLGGAGAAPGSVVQVPQGLYTAPDERDPLSRFAP